MEPAPSHATPLVWPVPGDPARVVRAIVERPADPSACARPCVLLLHGFKGFCEWGFFPELARRLARAGMIAVRMNSSGSGVGSDLETFTELDAFEHDTPSRTLEDLALAHERILREVEGVDRARLGLFGHSRGAAAVLLHAARVGGIAALALWSAVDGFDRFTREEKEAWRARGFLPVVNARTGQVLRMGLGFLEDIEHNAEPLDVLTACRSIRAPVLVAHGTADETVAPASSRRIAAALAHAETAWIEGAGHTFGATHPLRAVDALLEGVLSTTVAHFELHLHRRAGSAP